MSLRFRSCRNVKMPRDDVAFDLGEPELHVVQPGGVGRGTVQLYMRMGPQEGLDVGGLCAERLSRIT
jgi:hypothetical protein